VLVVFRTLPKFDTDSKSDDSDDSDDFIPQSGSCSSFGIALFEILLGFCSDILSESL